MNNINELTKELSQNFIEYAVAVNSDRAIPDAKSGLKPVARRILYGAFAEGRSSSKPHVKCARIVGDVMGALHPHGDSSIYGALVRLSQPWVMRYPLLDFHGNQGSINGDGPAAYRYTEARLNKLSEEGMLAGIKKRNVDFIPSYDESTEEPVTLPAVFPNLLCNPNTGIGVAMACNWLPHNLNEVAEAIKTYLDGGDPTLPGPDFPTGGLIINGEELPAIVKKGHGSVKLRAKYKVEKNNLVFYEIPYGVTIEGILADIGKLSEEQKINGISDVRDESNKKGIRVVVECEKGIDVEAVAQNLFALSDLQTSISYNQVGLINKTPTDLTLKDCCEIYTNHNIDCIIKESKFDLSKTTERLHIVDGLLKALEDIDNIIALIKQSANSTAAKEELIKKYNFSEKQAKAILAMRLSSLAGLEKIELQNEQKELIETKEKLMALIASDKLQKMELVKRLDAIVKKFGDARRTEITNIVLPKKVKAAAAKPEIIPEDCVVVLTEAGYIKRIPKKEFRVQVRGGKGVKTKNEIIKTTVSTNTVDTFFVFTNLGKIYSIKVDKIPVGSNATKGVNAATLLGLDKGEEIQTATSLYQDSNAEYLVCFTKNGLIKKTKLSEYLTARARQGSMALKLKEGDALANVTMLNDEDVIIVTKNRNILRIKTSDIAATGKATMGRKAIGLSDGNEVLVGLPISSKKTHLAIVTAAGLGRKIALDDVTTGSLGNKGMMITPKDSASIVGAAITDDNDKLFIYGDKSFICLETKNLVEYKGMVKGNIVIKDCVPSGVIKL